MDFFTGLVQNKPLLCALAGWFVASVLKIVIVLFEQKKFDITRFIGSGGMPSSHSAFVSAMATAVGIIEGFNSGVFAISFVLAFIVMYDAAGVRYAAGEQAKAINRIAKSLKDGNESFEEVFEKNLKELLGHTRPEVIVGCIVGIVTALVFIY